MQFSVQPFFGNVWWIAGAAAVFVVLALRMRDPRLTRKQALVMAAIRLAVLLIVCLALLRPGVTYSRQLGPTGKIAVLLDQSASMQLPSGTDTRTRWQAAIDLLGDLADAQDELPKNVAVELLTFDASVQSRGGSGEGATSSLAVAIDELPKTPPGAVTDLAGPLQSVADGSSDLPLQSIVWISDAIQTAEPSGVSPQQIARRLAESNVPLYLVGVGPRSGAEQSLDQWVDSLPEQVDAFSKNTVDLNGLLKVVGLTNRPLTLMTIVKDENGREISRQRQTLTPNRLEQTLPFTAAVTAPEPGSYEVEVVAAPVEGEATVLNNQQTTFMNVRRSGLRLLYVEGQPRIEQKFIRRALADSPDLQVDFLSLLENTRSQWPVDLPSLVDLNAYDCFLIGDIDSRALAGASLEAIAARVAGGAGLITLGGYHAYGPGGYDETALSDVLPVSLEGFPRQQFGPPNLEAHLPGPIQLQVRQPHPIFDLAGRAARGGDAASDPTGDAAAADWSELPPLLGASRMGTVLQQPGVSILAEGSRGEPLVIASAFEEGRVLAIAFDSSYVWWLGGYSDLHRRFWRQAVLWAMKPVEREPGLAITMDRRRLSVGGEADYEIEWTGPNEGDPMPPGLRTRLQPLGQVPRPLETRLTAPAVAEGSVDELAQPGRYEIIAEVEGPGGELYRERLPFDVVDNTAELLRGTPDWALMNQMAELNREAGGQLLTADQFDSLLELLKRTAERSSVELVQSHHLGEGELDSWLAYLLLAGLLSTQWYLRKRWSA